MIAQIFVTADREMKTSVCSFVNTHIRIIPRRKISSDIVVQRKSIASNCCLDALVITPLTTTDPREWLNYFKVVNKIVIVKPRNASVGRLLVWVSSIFPVSFDS